MLTRQICWHAENGISLLHGKAVITTTPAGGELSLLLCFAVRASSIGSRRLWSVTYPLRPLLLECTIARSPNAYRGPMPFSHLHLDIEASLFYHWDNCVGPRHNAKRMEKTSCAESQRYYEMVGSFFLPAHCASWFAAPLGLHIGNYLPSH